jgi:hypothetical protein
MLKPGAVSKTFDVPHHSVISERRHGSLPDRLVGVSAQYNETMNVGWPSLTP